MTRYDKDKMRDWMRKARTKRKSEGTCVTCGSRKARVDRVTCKTCFERGKEYRRRTYKPTGTKSGFGAVDAKTRQASQSKGGKASVKTVIVCKVCKEEIVKGSLLGHIRSKHPSKPRKLSSVKLSYEKERIPKAKPGDSLFK